MDVLQDLGHHSDFGIVDHNVVFVPYLADEEAETLDALFREDVDEEESELPSSVSSVPFSLNFCVLECTAQWIEDGKGLLSHKFCLSFRERLFSRLIYRIFKKRHGCRNQDET